MMSDGNTAKPKSILKKSPGPAPGPSINNNARQLAIHHANIFQTRKDLEATILESLEILSEYPTSTSSSAANPTSEDVAGFKKHVRLFQPSDYDDLVEERNVNDLCGYTLCPKPKPSSKGGKWTIRKGQIVDRHELEKWCSDDCKKRALYVKVQLSETAAWERIGMPHISIDLLGEDKSEVDRTAQKLSELQLEDQRRAAKDAAALAAERGEEEGDTSKMEKLKITLKEKETKAPDDNDAVFENEDYLRVEGHKTGEKTEKKRF